MPIRVSLEREHADALVSEACRRRQRAEIQFARPDGPPCTLPTVLVATSEDAFYVERPIGPDGPVEPAAGEQALIAFNTDERRFRLEAVVRGPKTLRLGPDADVAVIELDRPQRTCELQRRAEYRVPLSRVMPVTAHFEPLPVGNEADTPLAEPFHAQLQNISAGGVAALVSASARACLGIGQHYMMEFYLAGQEEPFTFAVRVQHIRRLKHNDARLIGLKYVPGDNSESTRRAIQEIRSFVDVHRRLGS